jgi:thiol:disulfide interchange protein DsbD
MRTRPALSWHAFAAGSLLLALAGVLGAAPAAAKKPGRADKIDFSVAVEAWPEDPFSDGNQAGAKLTQVAAGSTFRLVITGKPQAGFHTYPLTRRAKGQDATSLSSIEFPPSDVFQPLYPVEETAAEFALADTPQGKQYWLEHEKPFRWTQNVRVLSTAPTGPATLRFTIHAQVCDASFCDLKDLPFDIPLTITPSDGRVIPDFVGDTRTTPPPIEEVPVPADVPASGGPTSPAGMPAGDSGLLAFILQGIFWGAVSLVTPCVFPMIPITVSFFLKQSEKKHHRPVAMAIVYCATIVAVLTTSAVALLSFFTAVSTHALTNILMGGLFIFFALSLFGMYEIELPHSLAQFTSSREGQGGVIGTVFMALTFTIISFACVAPFLGGFAGTTAGAGIPWSHRVLGGLAFSATFASPFFLLALFPSLLRGLPKSGSWLNSVKVVMGFLELAAALKFLRAGERVWLSESSIFTFDVVLGMYVVIALLTSAYLLGWFRLPHDTPLEHIGVLRMLFAGMFLSLALNTAPGLMKTYDSRTGKWHNVRPTGVVFAWIESFLLPDAESDLTWIGNLEQGLAEARQKHRLVFVDFTGVTCTNCAYNEANVFSRPSVRDLLQNYTLVQLYTDRVPNKLYPREERDKLGSGTARQQADGKHNREFQAEKFNTTQLPLYVILRPTADGYQELARYAEGKINDPEAFEQFLRGPLEK